MKYKDKRAYSIIRAQEGVAMMMVLSSIAILTAIIFSFSYDAQINQIRSYNLMDQTQAKLSAESGLKLSMTRLRIYKEAFNLIQRSENLKQFGDASILSQIWSAPFIYPIPVSQDMPLTQKNLVEEFEKNSILKGEFQVSIQNLGNKLNLNLLRLSYLNPRNDQDEQSTNDQDSSELSFRGQFTELLRRAMDNKRQNDPAFEAEYNDISPDYLIALIEVYISDDPELCESDFCREAENAFQKESIFPKGAPLSNMDELYLLPVWNKELIDLIKNEISVHPLLMIDLDSMTSKMLTLIFPDLTEENIKNYFDWKNEPDDPKLIYQPEDLKVFFVENSGIIPNDEFDKRFDDLKKIGLEFGADTNLFKIISTGKYQEATYEIEAIISLPPLPKPTQEQLQASNTPVSPFATSRDTNTNSSKKKEYPLQLMEPRIVDFFVR